MNGKPTRGSGRILWQNVLTVVSAAILIGAEVFGAAFAGGWAVANLSRSRRSTATTSCKASSSSAASP